LPPGELVMAHTWSPAVGEPNLSVNVHHGFQDIMAFWGLTYKGMRPDIAMHGSPERAAYRSVVEDEKSTLFILEKIPSGSYSDKSRICRSLAFLSKRGMDTVQPYLCNDEGRYMMRRGNEKWQILPYIEGAPLQRPEYVFHGWRGKVAAEFLVHLRKASEGMPFFVQEHSFSLKDYFRDMTQKMRVHDPEIFTRFAPIIDFVEQAFLDIHDELPVAFCHGDYHPLNIIWSENGIASVIDWEFAGYKSDVYDVANMLGCIGIEEPKSLAGDFALDFISRTKAEGIISTISCKTLLEFIITLRFAWLAEWLRNRDHEMIALELDYMELLLDSRHTIGKKWGMKE